MKICISNVAHRMDEAELKRHLTRFGQVSSVKLVADKDTGERKGFGFIEMPVYDQAQTAIKALKGKKLYGRTISLTEAKEKLPGDLHHSEAPAQKKKGNYQDSSDEGVDGDKW